MGITEIFRRIWLFSANKIKSSELFSKQTAQLIMAAHNCQKGAGSRNLRDLLADHVTN